jgi:proline dehydrogenase
VKNPFKSFLWAGWDLLAKVLARPYFVGPKLEDALKACRRLEAANLSTTLCYWNVEQESAQQVMGAYLGALDALVGEKRDCYLSIKAPALKFDRACLSQVLDRGRSLGVRLHFDSLAPEAADATFYLIAEALPQNPGLGCTLPGRWHRSLADADWAAQRQVQVRVVKGQWEDPVKPEIDLREGFLAVIDRLAGRAHYVAVATHDAPLAQEALARLLQARTPCGVELLYGLPMKATLRVARAAGVKVRMYVPYGHGWAPYSLSQIRKNPGILWWVTRDLFR